MPNRPSYRWIKGLRGWIPSTVAPCSWNDNVEEETPPFEVAVEPSIQEVHDILLSDQAVVDKEAEDWASLWQETEQYTPPCFEAGQGNAGPLLEEGIRQAARDSALTT